MAEMNESPRCDIAFAAIPMSTATQKLSFNPPYALIIIDGAVAIAQPQLLSQVILECGTSNLLFVGPVANEAENEADYIIEDNELYDILTSSDEAYLVETVNDLAAAGLSNSNSIVYFYDLEKMDSKLFAQRLTEAFAA